MSSKVSFTIRPPTSAQASRPTSSINGSKFVPHAPDSSDEDGEGREELVVGFDESGLRRLHEQPKPAGPLVIPALANRDWRAVARKRKGQSFVPAGADAPVGKDGSQGGLGTKDTINSGPLVSGLVQKVRQTITTTEEDESATTVTEETTTEKMEVVEDEDERARRALLASVSGEDNEDISIDIIPIASNAYKGPMDETEAYKEDLATRPESATLDDYERVPVSQFGAALLRGMGWKPGTAASRTRKGPVEPYLPSSRPSLLGLGAKERPTEEIPGAGLKGVKVNTRPERKYIPIVQVKRQDSERPTPSRSQSRSPPPYRNVSRLPSSGSASPYPADDREGRRYKEKDGGRSRYSSSKRDYDRGDDYDRNHRSERERDRDGGLRRDSERDRRVDRGGDYKPDGRDSGRDRDRDRRRERDRDYAKERDYGKDSDRRDRRRD